MIKRLKLTQDHLKLINLIRFEDDELNNKVCVDKINPYILSGKLEDIAFALGLSNLAIPNTSDNENGAAFPDETEEYMLSIHHYIIDNIIDIEALIHQMVLKGGITAGTYKCISGEEIWEKEN